jgi:hypothetical protein
VAKVAMLGIIRAACGGRFRPQVSGVTLVPGDTPYHAG